LKTLSNTQGTEDRRMYASTRACTHKLNMYNTVLLFICFEFLERRMLLLIIKFGHGINIHI